ncbi:sensor histidine kinase [Streptomyces sp. NPDC051018]|uniref:sensor histidine kinase n=1 Tax=Streptomyces sp. NPDC051018 TaxID=3365639 RepID=UPI00379650C7
MILRALGGSLRVRLTVVFGLMFFLAGAAIFSGAVILVGNSMEYTLKLPFPSATQPAYEPPVMKTPLPEEAPNPVQTPNPAETSSPAPWQSVPADVQQEPPAWQTGGPVLIDPVSREQILDSMQRNLMAKGGLTVLCVGVVATTTGWLVAGRLLRPLSRITSTAERIAGRTLHRRIDLDEPPGEVKRLADSFDSMLDRLDEAFAGQDRFIANAAHELKTPLAVGRTLVEVAVARRSAPPEVKQLAENLLAVNERHERLIDSLLTLARAESTVTGLLPLDLADIAAAVVTHTAPAAQTRGIAVEAVLGPAPAMGDPVLLEQLVRNLVDNAVKYNIKGGWIRVETGSAAQGSRITVANTGAFIGAHEIPVLFEPFRRLTDRVGSARGSGLGLSIVRAVARTHNGDATAVPRPGGGLEVMATVPAVAENLVRAHRQPQRADTTVRLRAGDGTRTSG